MFYSAKTCGFYDPSFHGKNIPNDAVEISRDEYLALIDGNAQGKRIVSDKKGRPVLADSEPLSGNDLIKHQIIELEASVTQRRLREAAIGADGGWLKDINSKIASLREKLV